jgi:hypothetical protein
MLRGISVKQPSFLTGDMPVGTTRLRGYKGLQTFFPTLLDLNGNIGAVGGGKEVWMDHAWRVISIDVSGGTGVCSVLIQPNKNVVQEEASIQKKEVFLKVTHLLDPIHWIRGEYSLPTETGLPMNAKTSEKLQDPWNQAYVESVASYALGRLAEEGVSPHFNTFYGSFCANACIYRYNLSEDFYSYRDERWFWKGHDKNLFKMVVRNRKNPAEPVPEDIQKFVFDSELGSDYESSADSEEEELENIAVTGGGEMASLHSADSMSDVSYKESESGSGSGSESGSDILEDYEIHAEMKDYPVMLILTEKNTGTMEDLLTDFAAAGASPGMFEWEERWTAWIFQVIAALACAQKIIGFTHNDLHTNNIVWSPTDDEFLYYRTGVGRIYRVPTFGKLFKIIDFGRAIFTINDHMFISDDFKEDNDAGEQYAFSPLSTEFDKEVPPNPSFDLSRLAVSLLSGLFPVKPDEIEDGSILSKERGLVVKETVSELYNLLWSFMIDDAGKNIFMNPDESERFPDFDLYKHIAEAVHVAVPAEQVAKPIFRGFVFGGTISKVYPLFC